MTTYKVIRTINKLCKIHKHDHVYLRDQLTDLLSRDINDLTKNHIKYKLSELDEYKRNI